MLPRRNMDAILVKNVIRLGLVSLSRLMLVLFFAIQLGGILWYSTSLSGHNLILSLGSMATIAIVCFVPISALNTRSKVIFFVLTCSLGMVLSIVLFKPYWEYTGITPLGIAERLVFPMCFLILGVIAQKPKEL